MGICGVLYGLSTQIGVAIALVMISGLLQLAVVRVALGPAPAEHAARDARPGVLVVLRHARRRVPVRDGRRRPGRHPRHPDAHRRGVVAAVRLGGLHARRPGPRPSRPGAPRRLGCAARPRRRPSAAATARAATIADFDRLAGRLGAFTRLSPDQRAAFVRAAKVVDVAEGTRVIQHGDAATSAYFILDGSTTAGIPVDDGYAGLSTMTAGDFFGEIGALTGQPPDGRRRGRRRHDAARGPGRRAAGDDGRAGDPARRPVHDDQPAAADRGRRPAAPRRHRPGRPARPANAATGRRRPAADRTTSRASLSPSRQSGRLVATSALADAETVRYAHQPS